MKWPELFPGATHLKLRGFEGETTLKASGRMPTKTGFALRRKAPLRLPCKESSAR